MAQTWKQLGCLLIGRWINKLWYILTVQHFSGIKEMSCYARKGRGGNLNAYNWVKETYLKRLLTMIPTVWHSEKGQTVQTVRKSVITWDLRGGGEGWIGEAQEVFRAVRWFYMILWWCIQDVITYVRTQRTVPHRMHLYLNCRLL